MRHLLPALLLLCAACAPLASSSAPARYAPAMQATAQPDYIATAAVAQAAAEVAIAQTATAQAQAQSTKLAIASETYSASTAMYAAAGATQTAAAISVTLQAVSGAYATGTFEAGAATQTATAAIPAETQAAEVAATKAQQDGAAWWIVWGLVALVVVCLSFAGVNFARAQGAQKKAAGEALIIAAKSKADTEWREAQARAYSLEMAALTAATKIQIQGRMLVVIVAGEIKGARRLPDDAGERIIENAPQMSTALPDFALPVSLLYAGMFVKGAMREQPEVNKDDWPANRLPGVSHFDRAKKNNWASVYSWPGEIAPLVNTFSSGAMWDKAVKAMGDNITTDSSGTYVREGELAHLANKLRQAQSRAAILEN